MDRQRKAGPPPSREGTIMQSLEPWGTGHYVYAIGRLRARFPKEDVEQKYQQLLTPADMSAPTQEQRLHNVLSRPDNVSLAREMDWILEVQDVATYRLQPRSTTEFQLMLDALAPDELAQTGYDVVIGAQEPQAEGGEDLPVVSVHRLYHFTEESLVESIPLPRAIARMAAGPLKDRAVGSFQAFVLFIFQDLLLLADTTADAAKHRALNYVSLNYPDIYTLKWQTAAAGAAGMTFVGVDVRHSPRSSFRQILDVIFTYTDASGGALRYYTSVDVTGQSPFLVTRLQPYFER